MVSRLPDEIDALWQERDTLSPADEDARKTVESAVDLLDMGAARVAVVEEDTDEIVVDERARRALELLPSVFGVTESRVAEFGHRDGPPLKWRFDGVRVVPGAVARWGSYLAPGTVLMPSFVDVGSHVGAGTMVDTWATVGAGAQIGSGVHLSGGVVVGGMLHQPDVRPVVVEDDAFLGSRSVVADGARVRRGAKLGAGVILGGATRVVDAQTGEELPDGEAPAWSVCVSSTRINRFDGGEFGMPCLLVLTRLTEGQDHSKLMLDPLFREHRG